MGLEMLMHGRTEHKAVDQGQVRQTLVHTTVRLCGTHLYWPDPSKMLK